MNNIDTNIENYSLDELCSLLKIKKIESNEVINEKIDEYIYYFQTKQDVEMIKFFQEIKKKFGENFNDTEKESPNNTNQFMKPFYQKDTEEKNIVFDGEKPVIQRIYNEKSSLQDTLNPVLRNTQCKIINFNSIYRENKSSLTTNYNCKLEDPILNTIELKLYSYNIPFAWYAFNKQNGNYFFKINDLYVDIPYGNYSSDEFISEINNLSPLSTGENWQFSYNKKNGKIKLDSASHNITLFDVSMLDHNKNIKSNACLGWKMGFRPDNDGFTIKQGDTASSLLDLNGTKYLTLIVNDYNKSSTSNSIVSFRSFNNNIKLPDYNVYKTNNHVLEEEQNLLYNKRLTKAQMNTIEAINKNNTTVKSDYMDHSILSNAIEIINVNNVNKNFTDSLSVNNINNHTYIRKYMGPVNLENFTIQLIDDKNKVIDLNGSEWSFSLQATQLYQY